MILENKVLQVQWHKLMDAPCLELYLTILNFKRFYLIGAPHSLDWAVLRFLIYN